MIGEDAPENRVGDRRRAYLVRDLVRVRKAGEGGKGHAETYSVRGESRAPLAKARPFAQR